MKTRYVSSAVESVAEPTTAWTPNRQTHQSRTTNADDARQVIEAKNNSERQPVLNLQIAKAYLAAATTASPRGRGSTPLKR